MSCCVRCSMSHLGWRSCLCLHLLRVLVCPLAADLQCLPPTLESTLNISSVATTAAQQMHCIFLGDLDPPHCAACVM